ncbi:MULTISPECIES: phosphotransferase family protein [Saliphagus]|uniref:Phosphotransferase family protein n=1 Tax=Saliphagus infecundisoli TaxID=1849069 RepID=A0ABD5QJJ5_9EURY|nr:MULTISPECIES: phosphotransferase [Saliphagus]
MGDEEWSRSELSDAAVREMVDDLRETWSVETIERVEHGTDFVAVVGVETPDGPRSAVLKATTAGFVAPESARAEPRMLELVGRETRIPVPAVYGVRDHHPSLPAPFYLMEHVAGENHEGRSGELRRAVRERICGDAGRNLAALHELGPLPAAGTVGVVDGELAVLDSEDHPSYDDCREMVLDGSEDTLDALAEGGFFPGKADDRERFADLVDPLREYLRETIPTLSEPEPPTYHHRDYRYGNLLVDPDTGETQAVLDWAGTMAAEPASALAGTESLLFDPVDEDDDLVAGLRTAFRDAYADGREGWSFDAGVRERIEVYRLVDRLDAMACLPLWYEDATPAERDEQERYHREFLDRYL